MSNHFKDRNKLEIFNWPALVEHFWPLSQLCMGEGALSKKAKWEAFTILSSASGCRHCQAHGGYGLHLAGVPTERIQALWDFEHSPLFSAADKAILRFALAAGSCPNAVTPDHHAALREYFSDQQITELLAVVGISGFLNRYSDSLAVVTDQESLDWATVFLAPVGWTPGKHQGTVEEQRSGFPRLKENRPWE